MEIYFLPWIRPFCPVPLCSMHFKNWLPLTVFLDWFDIWKDHHHSVQLEILRIQIFSVDVFSACVIGFLTRGIWGCFFLGAVNLLLLLVSVCCTVVPPKQQHIEQRFLFLAAPRCLTFAEPAPWGELDRNQSLGSSLECQHVGRMLHSSLYPSVESLILFCFSFLKVLTFFSQVILAFFIVSCSSLISVISPLVS